MALFFQIKSVENLQNRGKIESSIKRKLENS